MVTLIVIELSFIACPALNFDGFEAILVEGCNAILENNADSSWKYAFKQPVQAIYSLILMLQYCKAKSLDMFSNV